MGPNKLYAKAIYGDEPTTMDELGLAIIKVLDQHCERRVSGRGKKAVYTESPKVQTVGLSWSVTHSNMVSNSHSSPEGFKQNWCGYGDKDNIPRGYPGWSGRVWVRYKKESGYSFGSDPFGRALAHTGTGGGGSYNGPWEAVSSARWHRYGHQRGPNMFPEVNCYSWDFRIFDADWPEVTANIIGQFEKDTMWATLNNKSGPISPQHTFLWEDPVQKMLDEQFIQECRELKNVPVAA